MGGPFVGTCRYCKRPGMKSSEANDECPGEATYDEAILDALDAPAPQEESEHE